MTVYIINVLLIFSWGALFYLSRMVTLNNNYYPVGEINIKNKHILIFLPFFQLFLILALKNLTVGTDTLMYKRGYELIKKLSWSDIFDISKKQLVFSFERGFIVLSRLISIFTDNFFIYNGILYAFMITVLYRFIKIHSPMPFVSVLLFIGLEFFSFYFSAIRQSLAITCVLISYEYIIKRRPIKFILAVTLAALFHKSAICFYPAYFLYGIYFTPLVGLLYFSGLIVFYLVRNTLVLSIVHLLYDSFEIEQTGSYTLLIIVLFTFILALIVYKQTIYKYPENDKEVKTIYNLSAIAAALMIFNTISMVGSRIARYYYIFYILLLPYVISGFRSKMLRQILTIILLSFVLGYYFLFGVDKLDCVPYTFFWE